MYVASGHFAKSGAGAPVDQTVNFTDDVSGLAFTPVCLIMWTAGGTVDGTLQFKATGDARGSYGFASSSAAGDQYAAGWEADTTNVGARIWGNRIAILLNTSATVAARASVKTFASGSFTITWDINNAEAQVFHYVVLGGPDVQAKVKDYNFTPVGAFSATGAGFQPNAMLGFGGHNSTADTGLASLNARVGAAVDPSNRWAVSVSSDLAASAASYRWHRVDRVMSQNFSGVESQGIDLTAFAADGATINVVTTGRCGILWLNVPAVSAGVYVKPTGAAPATGSVTGLNFKPRLVLMSSDQDINRANASQKTGARIGLSAFTIGASESSVISVDDSASAWAYLDKSGKAAVKLNNSTALDAEATHVMNGDGFSLTWNANDGIATEFPYLVLGEQYRAPMWPPTRKAESDLGVLY